MSKRPELKRQVSIKMVNSASSSENRPDCLTRIQIALLLYPSGLVAAEEKLCRDHLANCSKCRDIFKNMQETIDQMSLENDHRGDNGLCQAMLAKLGKVPDPADFSPELALHLQECPYCNIVLRYVEDEFTPHSLIESSEAPPAGLRDGVFSAIEKHFANSGSSKLPGKTGQLWESGISGIYQAIRFFLLPLQTTPEAIVMRGKDRTAGDQPKSYLEIVHDGGAITIQIDQAGVVAELYDAREKYWDEAESDSTGLITFPNIEAGHYKIRFRDYRYLPSNSN